MTAKPQSLRVFTFNIASGQTKSQVINLLGLTPVALELPALFTGTTIRFEGSLINDDAAVMKSIRNEDGTDYTLTVAQNRIYRIPSTVLTGLSRLVIVSGSAEGAARDIKLSARVMY